MLNEKVDQVAQPIVRLTDLIGVISDEFQPSLKIIDSRVINSDIHVWSTDISDERLLSGPNSEADARRPNGMHNKKPSKRVQQKMGPIVLNIRSIVSSLANPNRWKRSPQNHQHANGIYGRTTNPSISCNPHAGPVISDAYLRRKLLTSQDEDLLRFNPIYWNAWEDKISWEEGEGEEQENMSVFSASAHSISQTPTGSIGSLLVSTGHNTPKSRNVSSGMLLDTSLIPKITITSPVRTSSQNVSRLGESSTRLLLQEENSRHVGELSSSPLDDVSSSPSKPSPSSASQPPPPPLSCSSSDSNRLFGPSTSSLSQNSRGSLLDRSSAADGLVKTLKSKILNSVLASGAWDSFIVWDEDNIKTDGFHAFFQPYLSEMDPALILERIDSFSCSSSILMPPIAKRSNIITSPSVPKSDGSGQARGAAGPWPVPRSFSFPIISDRYNVSGDKYYLPKDLLAEEGQRPGTAGASNIALVHSIPALKLVKPFYKAWITKSELRSFHRFPFGAKYAPRVTFKKREEGLPLLSSSPGMDVVLPPHSVHASAMIPRSVKELTIVPSDSIDQQPSHLLLVEYSEEFHILVQKEGMGSLLYRYSRESRTSLPTTSPEGAIGISMTLGRHEPSPFLGFGDVRPGQTVLCLQNNLFRAPLFKHESAKTDFLLVRQWFDGVMQPSVLMEFPAIHVAGQTLPMVEVFGPQSRKANIYCKSRVEVAAYRQFQRPGNLSRRAKISKICRAFPQFQESVLRKWLKDISDYLRVNKDTGWWILKKTAPTLSEDELRALMTPEMVCIYEAMLAGKQRLLDAGLGHLADEDGNPRDDEDEFSSLVTEIKLAPWSITRNFILATQGKALVELNGSGDPTGCGEGFSFNRIPLKSNTFHQKRWSASPANDQSVLDEDKKYSIAEQQQAYREQIMKIWDAQYNALLNPNRLSQYKGISYEDQTMLPNSFHELDEVDEIDDETLSQSSSLSSSSSLGISSSTTIPPFPKQLLIKRKVLGEDGTSVLYQTELIKDSRIIIEYLEQKRFEEVARKKLVHLLSNFRKSSSAKIGGVPATTSAPVDDESGALLKKACYHILTTR
ncbi:hypothetical protein MDAP_000799 [Mitosporidium daphniae]